MLQDMTLEYLAHFLSRDVHFTVVTLSLKVLESCLYALKGWPAQADIIDLSSAIPITAASESQTGAGSH